MKKLLAIILSAALVLSLGACSSNGKDKARTPISNETSREETETVTETEAHPSETQEHPAETEATPSDDPVEEFVNYDNTYYLEGQITINPAHVYWENGELIAECYVVNGLDYTVSNIVVEELWLSNKEYKFAAGSFGLLENLILPAKTNAPWTFTFGKDAVINYGADLSYIESGGTVNHGGIGVPEAYKGEIEICKNMTGADLELRTIRISVGDKVTPNPVPTWGHDCIVFSVDSRIAAIEDGLYVRGVAPGETYGVVVSPSGSSYAFRIIVE